MNNPPLLLQQLVFNSVTNCLGPRKFLHSGKLFKAKSSKELYGFLFNDFLLLTQVSCCSSPRLRPLPGGKVTSAQDARSCFLRFVIEKYKRYLHQPLGFAHLTANKESESALMDFHLKMFFYRNRTKGWTDKEKTGLICALVQQRK